MNTFQPKVSIIIPVYNGENFMREAINSALSQTYENIEVIIINDGSNDNEATEKIALSYGSRIRYFAKENGGPATALNLGINKMTGDYFSWLSHDDMYHPQKIEKQISSISKDPLSTTISACNVTVIDEKGQKIKSDIISDRANRSMKCFLAIDTETGLNGCSLLIPKRLFQNYGFFNPNLKATQDYDLWFKFADHAQFVLLPDELVFSRRHDKQGGRTMGNLPTLEADQLHSTMLANIEISEIRKFIGNDLKYLENSYNIYKISGYYKTAARLLACLINIYLEVGDNKKALNLFENEFLGTIDTRYNDANEIINSIFTHNLVNDKPTVLVYSNVWVRGGIERVTSILFEELCQTYNFILVSNASQEPTDGFPLPEGVCHIGIRPGLTSELQFILLSLALLARASLVICHPNILTEVLKVYPVMKACGIKTIACNHYSYFLPTWAVWLFPLLRERLALLNEATVSTWLTSFNANLYALHNSNGALMPNPNSFETQAEGVFVVDEPTILCVGRFYDHVKRFDRMLKVFRLVLNQNPKARLILVGEYKLDQIYHGSSNSTYRELIHQLLFPEGAVVFEGDQSDVTKYYKNTSVLMLTSDYEGFPLVLNEAGSFGVPCVLFDIPGLEDIITDGVNGYIVPMGDLEGMAKKVNELVSNNELRRSMGQNAWTMSKRFNRKEICNRWSDLIDTVISTENKEELEMVIRDKFNSPPADFPIFFKTVVREYEKGIASIIATGGTKENLVPLINNTSISTDLTGGSSFGEGLNNERKNYWSLLKKSIPYLRQFGIRKTLNRIWEKLMVGE